MTMSRESHAALGRLTIATGDLLRILDDMARTARGDARDRWCDAAGTVRRYLALMTHGRATGDLQTMLRGANQLTAVNKGIADIAGPARAPGEAAFAVLKHAVAAAACLRADAGATF